MEYQKDLMIRPYTRKEYIRVVGILKKHVFTRTRVNSEFTQFVSVCENILITLYRSGERNPNLPSILPF